MKKMGLKLAAVIAAVAVTTTGICGNVKAQETEHEETATVAKEILPEGDGWKELTVEKTGEKYYQRSEDCIVTELEDTKVEEGKWYCIDYSGLMILEFGDNGYLKETWIDLNHCIEEQYIFSYTLEDSELTLQGKCFDYLEKKNELCLISQEEGHGYDRNVFYNSFSLAKSNYAEYEQTTYAIKDIADEDGFAIKDGILTGYIGEATEITIPEGVTEIATNAFSGELGRGTKLKKVTIGNNVTIINEYAFEDIAAAKSEGILIHCVENSYAAEYFEENRPYGRVRIVYGSEDESIGDVFYNTDITAADMQKKFPHGAFWNHLTNDTHDMTNYTDTGTCNAPDNYTWYECTSHGGGTYSDKVLPGVYHCNGFAETTECYGFAAKLTSEIYGYEYGCFQWPEVWWKSEWESNTDYQIKPGDVVYYEGAGAGGYGHRGMVIDVDGTKVRLAECNWGRRCQISWGRWMDLNDTSFCTIHVAPYALPDGGEDVIIDFKKGDLDGSGYRELTDAQACLKGALKITKMDEDAICCADMDGDGTVSLADAQFLLKVVLKIVRIS